MKADTIFSIIYFALFVVFYMIGTSKTFIIIYFIFGVAGFIYFDHYKKTKKK